MHLLGSKALPALKKAAESHDDPEIRVRAASIVKHLTQIHWVTDFHAALRQAKKSGKRLLVFSTGGPLDGYT